MGTWGAGNFENDGAADYLIGVIEEFANRIENILEEGEANLDERGEEELVPNIAIISALCRELGASAPERESITEWKEKYLQIFDEQIEDFEPEEGYAEERRRVIEETFDELLELAD